MLPVDYSRMGDTSLIRWEDELLAPQTDSRARRKSLYTSNDLPVRGVVVFPGWWVEQLPAARGSNLWGLMDFLMLELNREANTLSSKPARGGRPESAHRQMREQVRTIE